jgi:hypothetical protein
MYHDVKKYFKIGALVSLGGLIFLKILWGFLKLWKQD